MSARTLPPAQLHERGIPGALHRDGYHPTQTRGHPTDYRYLSFLSEDEFDRLLAQDGLLEHAQVYGYHYGVPKAQVEAALARGVDVIMRVDVQGAATIKRLAPAAVSIFLAPPSMAELEARLRARGLDDAVVIRKRLDAAQRELAERSKFDYVVVNEHDRLDEAADTVLAIMTAERASRGAPAWHFAGSAK